MSQAAVQVNAKRTLLANATWLFGDKIIRMMLGLSISVIMARILGPEELGKWNYAESFFGMFLVLTTLGFDAIIVRELVKDNSKAGELLGTAIGLKFIGTLLAITASYIGISMLRPDDSTIRSINLILATASIFQLFDVIDYWFRSQMQSKYTVIAKNIAFIISCLIKIILLLNNVSIVFVAVSAHIEFIVGSLLLLYFYKRNKQSPLGWRLNFRKAKFLLANSWPLILSSSAIFVQARIDQIMIGEMLGDAAVGQYSVALRLIEVLGFIPVVISTAFAPIVTKSKLANEDEYKRTLSSVYRIMFILFLITAIPIYFLSNHIVILLYGIDYSQAGSLLSLFAIRLFFTNFGVAKSLFITNESLFKYTLITSLVGAGSNIILNYLLIPIMGVTGSLVATILSFSISVFIIDLFFKRKIRSNLLLMLNSIITFWKFKIDEVKVGD
ncbi:flippase [Cytobacillus firmus]|uniref:flippase n=1 Tax=Paenibacillus lautus TaxID=1401 RepID=UPI0038509FFF|nr:flippase [Cytobacillus firmus]